MINFNNVLILVVVDNGLVQIADATNQTTNISLNPCCSGQWSRTRSLVNYKLLALKS